ncbi:MAG: hypothetical protein BWY76_01303 [bacterium ADurb.Bin429]|nr:MAG: hypothetical protein BWY76_01303 [bacterium ADurb.Bin429]
MESADRPAVELSARLSGDRLVGGGQKPSPARGTLSFLGRRIKAGDEVVVKIGSERVAYTIPAENTNLSALLAALVGRINAAPALAGANGVRAFPDPDGMPVLLLEARAPGETGNRIPYAVTVTPVEGSQLRAYPDTPSRLMGGHDGSSASAQLAFVLGEPAVRRTVLLDTSRLSDGMHRLRAVACDASPAQAQGFAEITVQVRNLPDGPTVSLPDQLWTALGKVTVPVEAGEGIAKVEVFVDGQLLGAADAAPFAVDVPLTTLGRGAHDLWAEGVTAEGQRYRTVTTTLSVVVPPEVLRVTPDHAQPRGSVTHRVVGTGFQPDCTVRLAGVPAKTVIYHSPNTLDVVSEAGEAKRGPVDVMNPDGTTGSLPNAFEYYLPRVASTKITPTRDVVRPKGMARFTAKCFDQYGYPITAVITWTANGGAITHDGLFTAPPTTGQYLVHAAHPDAPKGWDAPITVGQADIPGGVLRHWLLLGAFQDEDGTGLEKAYIPETTVLPSHDETLAGNTWVSYAAPTPFVDLTERLSPVSNTIAYAHVYLKSPAEMDATLVFGSDDGIAMWLNGAPVYSLRVRRAADPNQARLPVHLRVGWNRLLVKVDQGTGSWGFYLRLQTREGQPLTGLAYALDNPH